MKKITSTVFGKFLGLILTFAIQIAAFIVVFIFFRDKFAFFYGVCALISLLAAVHVLNDNSNPAYKIAWIIPLLLFPIFGGLFYLMFGLTHLSKKKRLKLAEASRRYDQAMAETNDAYEKLRQTHPNAAIQSTYLLHAANVPPFQHTQTEYLPIGEAMFARLLEELQKAEHFIFMEYFILQEGKMWNSLLNVLEQKAKSGVDVRICYDDIGCLPTLPAHYDRFLESKGIKACIFNRFNFILSSRFNNRDHRKICVIDGNVGFTGGINLADEYINAIEKHGHWKDSAVLLRGEAVWSLTAMFLSMWDAVRGESEEFQPYAPSPASVAATPDDGYVQPFGDSPLDHENTGENAYLNLITRAQKYVYITTPYLIVGNEMLTALQNAAKNGIDVRIITPHIPDKRFVHATTRSHYSVLIRAGVRIYEYTPGFIHAKTFVSDDQYAIVGTINMDFRSLYLHYECAAWMYGSRAVGQVREDFDKTLEKCQEITKDHVQRYSGLKELFMTVLRVLAPLM